VSLSNLVQQVLDELQGEREGRQVEIRVDPLPDCLGDASLLKQVFVNLLTNALKFTRKREQALIEISAHEEGGELVGFVRDNGAGFDMQFADKLFGVFQRLHSNDQFEGTGVGLSIVQRIIHRHGGRIWAEAAVDKGATFHFTLPIPTSTSPA
jgi:light-regulated signal transduction histidine kinase (bacteriophytochrome)